jgi:hypothetical protein
VTGWPTSPCRGDDELLRFHFEALHFARLLEAFGDHSLIDLSIRQPERR